MNVLCVDDEPDITTLWNVWLTARDHTVVTSNDPLEVAGHPKMLDGIDVAVIDLMMPMMNGGELSSWIAKAAPDVRIVIASASTPELSHIDVPDKATVLRKPVDERQFLDAIEGPSGE